MCWGAEKKKKRREIERRVVLLSLLELFGVSALALIPLLGRKVWSVIFKVPSLLMLFILVFCIFWSLKPWLFPPLLVLVHQHHFYECSQSLPISGLSSKDFIAVSCVAVPAPPLSTVYLLSRMLFVVSFPSSSGFYFCSFVVNKNAEPVLLKGILWPLTHLFSMCSPLTG